jgi:hypothetical protein
MTDYGVTFDTTPPDKFDRAHVFIRILIFVILSIVAGAIGWLLAIIYLGIPVLAAVLISQKGPERYLAEADASITKWLRYIVGFYAYLSLLTDRLPTSDSAAEQPVLFEVMPSGSPSAGNALLRLILAIPSALVLALLWLVGAVLLVIAAVAVLVSESYPRGIYDFLRGLSRWEARLLAYLASLVDAYPPFSLDTQQIEGPSTSG